ncbi:MAG: phosphoglucosamine mutase, partial [Candidatus Brocadia sp.]|nr:phosphoglucosamine mutase [Candidatus Brocadia sp.]
MKKLFGTDGIRGIANRFPMTPELVVNIGKATAHAFKEKYGKARPKLIIGRDTRLSGCMIENALTSGILSAGADVFLVGHMPTPAIAHVTKSLNVDAGLVISASH